MTEHPIHTHMSPGMRIIYPFSTEYTTWGDLRELAALGRHYPDDDTIEWDTTTRDVCGPGYDPDGIIIRRAGDLDG